MSDEMFKLSILAAAQGVSQRTLRFYEEMASCKDRQRKLLDLTKLMVGTDVDAQKMMGAA